MGQSKVKNLDLIAYSSQPSLPFHCVAVAQCPRPVAHEDDGFVDDFSGVSAFPRPASVVQSPHLSSQ